MKGDLAGFIVYISAILGVIFIITIIAKKTFTINADKRKTRFLKIESRLNIEPRKNLYVVKAGYERFLISSGIEGCQFMAKIENDNIPEKCQTNITNIVEAPDMNIININKPGIDSGSCGGRQKWI